MSYFYKVRERFAFFIQKEYFCIPEHLERTKQTSEAFCAGQKTINDQRKPCNKSNSMKKGIDCFVVYTDAETTTATVSQLYNEPLVNNIYVLLREDEDCSLEGCKTMRMKSRSSSVALKRIGEAATAPYALLFGKKAKITLGYQALKRYYMVAESVDPAIVYADRYVAKDGKLTPTPTMDFYYGSVRDDFDFGSLVLISTSLLRDYLKENPTADYQYAAWYDLQLFALRRKRQAALFHVREFLYTEEEPPQSQQEGEKQFDYVNPRNREVQKEKELVCTEHLKTIGSYIDPESIAEVQVDRHEFEIEASVIIPVRNRVKTIGDAIKSALSQQTTFPFNVMVVDNLSTDGTTELIEQLAAEDERVVHIIPDRQDLGIGGCWSLAFNDARCGRFAVQLDSDDLYSGTDTLQRIVDKFYAERCGMVIGSYRICNFQLETLPPGLIDHREWTEENGHNNALRVNGLGAPRAFFTPLLRKIGMPNSSYGEDYAVGLAFCRKYKIGRIYDELYLCRRWEGNSDASLTPEQVNRNNIYKDSLRTMEIIDRRRLNEYWMGLISDEIVNDFFERQLLQWEEVRDHYAQLEKVAMKRFELEECRLDVQFNPARMVSTGAKVDAQTISQRPCFLCDAARPEEQICNPMLTKYYLLVNPHPILPKHFTISLRHHRKQQILGYYEDMMEIASMLDDMFVFYNGSLCGASAPDHLHFQAGSRGIVPLERDWLELYHPYRSRVWPISEEEYLEALNLEQVADSTGVFSLRGYVCPGIVIITRTSHANQMLFEKIYHALPIAEGQDEPMMNVLAWTYRSSGDGTKRIVSVIIPRSKHRPDCYYQKGKKQLLVSPGALDMAGLLITPREEDYQKITAEQAQSIIAECGITRDEELDVVVNFKGGVKLQNHPEK